MRRRECQTQNLFTRQFSVQGFLKVHGSLTALITHHSIMPELLPLPLNIHRHNPNFSDTDPDYASLQVRASLGRERDSV